MAIKRFEVTFYLDTQKDITTDKKAFEDFNDTLKMAISTFGYGTVPNEKVEVKFIESLRESKFDRYK